MRRGAHWTAYSGDDREIGFEQECEAVERFEEKTMHEPTAFERDTSHRLITEAARHWCISHALATGDVPERGVFFAYPDGPVGFMWGNAPGPDNPAVKPLRGKRYRITIELEDA